MQTIDQIRLGSVLLSIIEPTLGHEVECHRWHERDHFFAGFMVGANFFSGRRWIATQRLKDLRYPQHSPVTDSVDKGSFLGVYWMLAGQDSSAVKWSVDQFKKLKQNNRIQPPRENVSTAFYQYCWGVSRDDDGVPAELALEHPFCGLAVMMIDKNKKISDNEFEQFCRQRFLPGQMRRSAIAMTLCLRPRPLSEHELVDPVPDFLSPVSSDLLAHRYLLLSFLEEDPQLCWPDKFANVGLDLQGGGYGEVVYAAPFIPTVPGTDRYVDQL